MIAYFDVEMSGQFDPAADISAHHQPHIVRLAAGLYDGEREVMVADVIVRPIDFKISETSVLVHGVTQDMAFRIGIPLRTALSLLVNITANAEKLVCYGLDYNVRQVQVEFERHAYANKWPHAGQESVCAMKLATNLCKIPHPSKHGEYKFPKLPEAVSILLGSEHPQQNCLEDMRAAVRLYRHMQKMGAA